MYQGSFKKIGPFNIFVLCFRRGNCKNASLSAGRCEIGLRRKTYNVLAGSVLSVWSQVEAVLTHDGNRKGTNSRMQVSSLMHYFSVIRWLKFWPKEGSVLFHDSLMMLSSLL